SGGGRRRCREAGGPRRRRGPGSRTARSRRRERAGPDRWASSSVLLVDLGTALWRPEDVGGAHRQDGDGDDGEADGGAEQGGHRVSLRAAWLHGQAVQRQMRQAPRSWVSRFTSAP